MKNFSLGDGGNRKSTTQVRTVMCTTLPCAQAPGGGAALAFLLSGVAPFVHCTGSGQLPSSPLLAPARFPRSALVASGPQRESHVWRVEEGRGRVGARMERELCHFGRRLAIVEGAALPCPAPPCLAVPHPALPCPALSRAPAGRPVRWNECRVRDLLPTHAHARRAAQRHGKPCPINKALSFQNSP